MAVKYGSALFICHFLATCKYLTKQSVPLYIFPFYTINNIIIFMDTGKKIYSSIIAAIIGDSLGVPAEFSSQQELSLCAVKNMFGYGRYDHPQGTWSDDSAMILCTIESLCKGYDIEMLAHTFCKWLFEAHWTATGVVFDAGIATVVALDQIRTEGKSARESGSKLEQDNGNGSLMRILPAALFFHKLPLNDFLERIHEVSSITHAHPRALIGCGLYSLLIRELLKNNDKIAALHSAVALALEYYNRYPEFKNELCQYIRILSFELLTLEEQEIRSSGYIVDTLEAAFWCFLKNKSTSTTLLSAVNLGLDTDTTGTVAGGLAGVQYGLDDIPENWLDSLARKEEIDQLVSQFTSTIINGTTIPET